MTPFRWASSMNVLGGSPLGASRPIIFAYRLRDEIASKPFPKAAIFCFKGTHLLRVLGAW